MYVYIGLHLQWSFEVVVLSIHDDVIKWKHCPRYWPFVRGIHRSPVNSLNKGQWRGALMFSLICVLIKRLSKQSWGWWSKTPTRSLWRHCNVIRVYINDNYMAWPRYPHHRPFDQGSVVTVRFPYLYPERLWIKLILSHRASDAALWRFLCW